MRTPVLERVEKRSGAVGGAAYAGVLCILVLAVSGAIGLLLKSPWLFPSLGPTVMLFFSSPKDASSRPLNAAVGHAVGIVAGILCLFLFGMNGMPSAAESGLTPGYLAAGALSVGITAFVLHVLKVPHPPAGATTLIISLGIIATPVGILSMAAAIAFVIVLGWAINWLLGIAPAGVRE